MTDALDPSDHFALPPGEVPLGIRHPLLPADGLGQQWLQPKFLTPLGARSLTVLDPSVFSSLSASELDWQSPFQNSPFFDAPETSSPSAPATQSGQATPQTPNLQTRPLEPSLALVSAQALSVESLSPAVEKPFSTPLDATVHKASSKAGSEAGSDVVNEAVSDVDSEVGSETVGDREPVGEVTSEITAPTEPPIIASVSNVPIPSIARSPLEATAHSESSPASPSLQPPTLDASISSIQLPDLPLSVGESSQAFTEVKPDLVPELAGEVNDSPGSLVSTEDEDHPLLASSSAELPITSFITENSPLQPISSVTEPAIARAMGDTPLQPGFPIDELPVQAGSQSVQPAIAPSVEQTTSPTASPIENSPLQPISSVTEPAIARSVVDYPPQPRSESLEESPAQFVSTSVNPAITASVTDNSAPQSVEEFVENSDAQPVNRMTEPAIARLAVDQSSQSQSASPSEDLPLQSVSNSAEMEIVQSAEPYPQSEPIRENSPSQATSIITEPAIARSIADYSPQTRSESLEESPAQFVGTSAEPAIADSAAALPQLEPISDESPALAMNVEKSLAQAVTNAAEPTIARFVDSTTVLPAQPIEDALSQPIRGSEDPSIVSLLDRESPELPSTVAESTLTVEPLPASPTVQRLVEPAILGNEAANPMQPNLPQNHPPGVGELVDGMTPATIDRPSGDRPLGEQSPAPSSQNVREQRPRFIPDVGALPTSPPIVQPTLESASEAESLAPQNLAQPAVQLQPASPLAASEIPQPATTESLMASRLAEPEAPGSGVSSVKVSDIEVSSVETSSAGVPSLKASSIEAPSAEASSAGVSSIEVPSAEGSGDAQPSIVSPDLDTSLRSSRESSRGETGHSHTENSQQPTIVDRVSEPIATDLPTQTLSELPSVIQRLSVWEPLVQLQPIHQALGASQTLGVASDARSSSLSPSTSFPEIPSPAVQRSQPSDQRSQPSPSPNLPMADDLAYDSGKFTSALPTEWATIEDLLQDSQDSRSTRQDVEVTSADGYADLNLYPDLSRTSPVVQTLSDPDRALPVSESSTDSAQATDHNQAAEQTQAASPEQLERLAQEIYQLVKQRLALERERSGSGYSHRLL